MKTKKIFNTLFREKPALMLLHMLNNESDVYASSLAKSVDCTYSHVVKVLQFFEKYNLISFTKMDRRKIIKLTAKGKRVATAIEQIRKDL